MVCCWRRRPVKSHKVQMVPWGIIKQQKAAIKRHKHVRNTNAARQSGNGKWYGGWMAEYLDSWMGGMSWVR